MPRREPERVLCAAIWVDDGRTYPHQPVPTGVVLGGWRHHVILGQIVSWYDSLEAAIERDRSREHQGFLTTKGRFIDREEAMAVALAQGQVQRGETHRDDELFSEDLYG